MVARFDVDGAVRDATLTGVQVAPTTAAASLAFTLVNGSITLTRSFPGDTTCVSRPTIEMQTITPYLDEKSAADSALQEVESAGSDRPLTPADVTGAAAEQCATNEP